MTSSRDLQILAGQLDREPRDVSGIACRCPFGYAAVIETGPSLAGEPNPTLLYLTCPSMVKAVSQVESTGAVKRFREACRADPELRAPLAELTGIYRQRRQQLGEIVWAERPGGERAPGGEPGAAPGAPAGAPAPDQCGAARPGVRPEAGIGGPRGPEVASCLHAYAAAMLAVLGGWRAAGAHAGSADTDAAVAGRDLAERLQTVWRRFLPPSDDCWCADRACARWDTGSRPAAIDVGTISVRLLVAEMEAGRPNTLVRQAEITRLGEALRPGGRLAEAAKERTAAAVARFAQQARQAGAESIVLAATSAARDAADGPEFIAGLGLEHGLEAAVLTGDREAYLAYTGASLDVSGSPLVLDIGGGSTEIMRPHGRAGVAAVSLELGASRATERWLRSDPPGRAELDAAAADAAHILHQGLRKLGLDEVPGARVRAAARSHTAAHAQAEPHGALVGVAGTVTTLACLDAGLAIYDSEALHLRRLTLDSVRRLVRRLSGLTTAERAALPCVQAGRAPVLIGGAVIVQAAMEALGYSELTVSERDILDGLVMCGLEAAAASG